MGARAASWERRESQTTPPLLLVQARRLDGCTIASMSMRMVPASVLTMRARHPDRAA